MSLSSLQQYLAATPVSAMLHKEQVFAIPHTTPVYDAFVELIRRKFQAAPVYNSDTKKFVGFLDLRDLVSFVVICARLDANNSLRKAVDDASANAADQHARAARFLQGVFSRGDITEKAKMFDDPKDGYSVSYLAARNRFCPVEEKSSLLDVAKHLAQSAHRVPVVDASGQLIGLVTQSRFIQHLHKAKASFGDALNATVGQMKLGTRPALSVKASTRTYDAFSMMNDKHITGLAITADEDGRFVGVVSGVDLKLYIADPRMEILDLNIFKFLSIIRQADLTTKFPTVGVRESDSLGKVIDKLAATKLHRVFIVDNDDASYRPMGVIALTDILRLITQ